MTYDYRQESRMWGIWWKIEMRRVLDDVRLQTRKSDVRDLMKDRNEWWSLADGYCVRSKVYYTLSQLSFLLQQILMLPIDCLRPLLMDCNGWQLLCRVWRRRDPCVGLIRVYLPPSMKDANSSYEIISTSLFQKTTFWNRSELLKLEVKSTW